VKEHYPKNHDALNESHEYLSRASAGFDTESCRPIFSVEWLCGMKGREKARFGLVLTQPQLLLETVLEFDRRPAQACVHIPA
jgi:hypothetical protein